VAARFSVRCCSRARNVTGQYQLATAFIPGFSLPDRSRFTVIPGGQA
jgi:hypothetical protein